MSSISSISSATNPYQTTNQNNIGQFVQDFKAIGSALQSGNLSTAQSALATFQQALPGNSQTSSSQPFGSNTQANTAYQSLTTALQSGNLSTAQQAFASLQTDLKSAQSAHKGHHHHHSSDVTASTASSTTPTTTTSSVVGSDGSLNATA
jgi:outer membrane protein assembly factor BamD (BamD/ComL family)